ncbi:sigma factor-like helix-turn-helix DNA-binding protein [Achromobacter xylosoxidans]
MAGMFKALDMLTPRQRDILVAARVDGLSRPELAQRWGISLRLVGRELQTAHEHCLRAMRRAQDVATPGQPPVEPGRRGQRAKK